MLFAWVFRRHAGHYPGPGGRHKEKLAGSTELTRTAAGLALR
jgi:hypothetical protein